MTIGDGRQIKIKFTQPLIGDVDGLQTPVAYKQVKVSAKGATHSAQNVYSSSYPASNAFDGNNSTYWYGTSSTNWIKTKFKEPKNITGLRLYMGSYYIKTFTISGSNDDSTWVKLGDTFEATASSQWFEYTFENTESYLYYKLDTLTTYSSYVCICELEWTETAKAGNETKFTVSFDEYDYIPGGTLSRKTRSVESFEANKSFYKNVDIESCEMTGLQIIRGSIVLGYKEVTEDG